MAALRGLSVVRGTTYGTHMGIAFLIENMLYCYLLKQNLAIWQNLPNISSTKLLSNAILENPLM